MHSGELTVADPDGLSSLVFNWSPDSSPRSVLHLLHGWGEHALRYDRVATRLAAAGIAVYADDHRGHGQTGVRGGTLGDLGPRAMDGVLDAVRAVSLEVQGAHPGVPFFAFGHSWGSFILQRYLRRWGSDLAGAILSGTTYRDPDAPAAPRQPPNAKFEPARTPYDWLTRDEAEVDKYIADPLCGFEVMHSRPAITPESPAAVRPIPIDLPILIINGSDDPIGGAVGGAALADHYRGQGLEDVTLIAYEGGRHEMLNEVNRDEVENDVLGWLLARC